MMNATQKSVELVQCIRRVDGFAVYVLGNRRVELAAAPELGARIISLRNARTGREWMWHPPGVLRLFRNGLGDDFSSSTLAGVDECLPTIAPCAWQGRALPDHGEVWSASWKVDDAAWKDGALTTSTHLKISPFDLERMIELRENEIRLSYRLSNRGAAEESFLWAMHPLVRLCAGDRLILPASTRALLNGETWIDAVDSAMPNGNCSKLYAWPVREGAAGICNQNTGDRLDFEWNPAENRGLGLWLTRGGWHGHHHFALEPANSDGDTLAQAAERKHCGVVAPGGSARWQVRFRIGP